MAKYGEVAVGAVALLARNSDLSPRDGWARSVAVVIPDSESSRAKGCPLDAFLTLCEVGAVGNVAAGTYTRSVKNKAYVTRALSALRSDPSLADDQQRLWQVATAGEEKRPNYQMEVLTTLWNRGLIRR